MQRASAEEQQRVLGIVLNQLKKKNLSGLLAAQRNGTLDEFVKPHVDAYWEKEANKTAAARY
jgi:hypothetical protein